MKYIKKILIVLILLSVLSIGLLWILAQTMNPNAIKGFVSHKISQLTEQSAEINGTFQWKLLPRPAIKVTNIQIGDKNNIKDYHLIIDNLMFNLQLSPLLHKKLIFNEVTIDGIHLTLPSQKSVVKQPIAINKKINKNLSTQHAVQFSTDNLSISHGEIIVNGEQSVKINNIRLDAKQINLENTPFPIQLKGNVIAKQPSFSSFVLFTGHISLSQNAFNSPDTLVKNLHIEGQSTLKDVVFNQIKIQELNASIKNTESGLTLAPLNLSLYDGKSVGNLNYNHQTNLLTFDQTATNLDATTLFSDLTQQKILQGKMDCSIHGSLNTKSQNWLASTILRGNLTMNNGKLEMLDISTLVDETIDGITSLLKDESLNITKLLDSIKILPNNYLKGSTPFQLLSISYQLQNNLLNIQPIVLKTNHLMVEAMAKVELPSQQLTGNMTAKFLESKGEIATIQKKLGGQFPFQIQGTVTNPLFIPDFKQLTNVLGKKWLEKNLNKALQPLQSSGFKINF